MIYMYMCKCAVLPTELPRQLSWLSSNHPCTYMYVHPCICTCTCTFCRCLSCKHVFVCVYYFLCVVGIQREQAVKIAHFLGISEDLTDSVRVGLHVHCTCTCTCIYVYIVCIHMHFTYSTCTCKSQLCSYRENPCTCTCTCKSEYIIL